MRSLSFFLIVFCLGITSLAQKSDALEKRKVENFNKDWRFNLNDTVSFKNVDFDDSKWRKLELPHDWSIEGVFDKNNSGRNAWLPGGVGWYRKKFELPVSAKGSYVQIQFDGVYRHAQVYVNGEHVGAQYDGYTSFYFDISHCVFFDRPNVIAVKVDNSVQPNCRWYSGSGIYRNTWLTITNPTHIENWGTYITTPKVNKEKALVRIETTLENFENREEVNIISLVFDENGNKVAESSSILNASLRKDYVVRQEVEIINPKLWDTKTPHLYSVISKVLVDDNLLDDYQSSFGIRSIKFDAKKGFFLNGINQKLKGVCLHHDAGDLGAAVPIEIWRSRLTSLKEIGCNAIRTAHNATAPEFMDLCDELGFLVMDEFVDKWYDNQPYASAKASKSNFFNPSGFGDPNFYLEWEKNYSETIKRDRNHPSVIMWSVGNENHSPGDVRQKLGLKKYTSLVRTLDPTRPVISGMERGKDGVPSEKVNAIIETCKEMDLIALNYGEQWCKAIGEKEPGKPYVSTESYVYFNSAAEKRFSNIEKAPWLDVLENDHNMGLFLWVGIDYLGEAKKFPAMGTNCGLLDKAGFRKEISYLYEAFWSEKPMVRIAIYEDDADDFSKSGRWWFPKIMETWSLDRDSTNDIVTYTNCDSVDLYVNSKKIGSKNRKDFENWIVKWRKIPFEPGKIKAIGIIDGKEVCEFEVSTAKKLKKISLLPSKKKLLPNEVIEVDVQLEDTNGILVREEINLTAKIDGDASILAFSNGDMSDTRSAASKTFCTTKEGRCKLILKAGKVAGKVRINVLSDNVLKTSLRLKID